MSTSTFRRLLALLFSLALVASACGSSSEGSDANTTEGGSDTTAAGSDTTTAPDTASGPLTMAIVAPSASNDLAFTQSMIESIDALGRDIDLAVTDGTFVVEEAAAAIRAYAEEGREVIIVHGTQFGGSLAEIAPEFPETTFIWGTATETQGLDNVFAYYPQADQGGYVEGVLAAAISASGNIGVVGPVEAGDAVAYINGFDKGATDNGATVSIVYTGSFSDVALAAETAQALIANGADVLTGSAQMVVGAVGVAVENSVPWFGTQANQSSLSAEFVVASQVYHWEVVLEEMLALRDAGTLGGEAFAINLENGGLVVEMNPDYPGAADLQATLDETIAGIIDGSIDTGA